MASPGIAAAQLSGAVSRLTRGDQQGLTRSEKLAVIAEITTVPAVLGKVMGPLLTPEHPEFGPADAEAVELLRAAGADEQVAAATAAAIEERRERRLLGRYADGA
jgi:Na+-transporting methylmalonyl-CoA/oxaloacetate decarboxylase gamma subunit